MLGQTRNKKNKEIISAMCIVMAVAVVALAVLVIGKKRMF